MHHSAIEFGSERIPRSLLCGKRANTGQYYFLSIEDSPQRAAERFNTAHLTLLSARLIDMAKKNRANG